MSSPVANLRGAPVEHVEAWQWLDLPDEGDNAAIDAGQALSSLMGGDGAYQVGTGAITLVKFGRLPEVLRPLFKQIEQIDSVIPWPGCGEIFQASRSPARGLLGDCAYACMGGY